MGELNMNSFENAAGQEMRTTAESHRDFLRGALTEVNLDAWKAAGLIDDEGRALLAECLEPENYIAKSDEQRAHIDQLVESLKKSGETS